MKRLLLGQVSAQDLHVQHARLHARRAAFDQMRAALASIEAEGELGVELGLEVAALQHSAGFLSDAWSTLERLSERAPEDGRVQAAQASIALDRGEHALSREISTRLLRAHPHDERVQRQLLMAMAYDPQCSDAEHLAAARAWGAWAMAQAGGAQARPLVRERGDAPLRVGYLGADFCQHTVGLLVKGVLAAHDRQRVEVYVYSAGEVYDAVSQAIKATSHWRRVNRLSDQALVAQIRADAIDVLVDLSGHTAGSRVRVFAHRPAPVQVSWLGYFATTGLPEMDAVLLDAVHAPASVQAQFVESVVRLRGGRLCYQAQDWMQALTPAPVPSAQSGVITFGSFNNTAKYTPQVLATWAAILKAVPQSRLVLKWRNFNDEGLRQQVHRAFDTLGVDVSRVDLRGPSFHKDMLAEYADIDIALDPFPFTGGLTSFEALWMGVPVVTLAGQRVVGRQSAAFLHAMGRADWVASDLSAYVQIAKDLAADSAALEHWRDALRPVMLESPLCDVQGFTRSLEQALQALVQQVHAQQRLAALEPVVAHLERRLQLTQTAQQAYAQALMAALPGAANKVS